jgi:membrane protein
MVTKFMNYVRTDLWRLRLEEMSRSKFFLIRWLRIVVLSVRGFDEDNCMLRASALTFYTLLSIVPIFAMMFGIAKGFGMEDRVEQELLKNFQGQEEVILQIVGFARNMLDHAQGGLIAGIGVIFLFWAIIKVLGNIEGSFNHIWGIKKGRSLGRKFSDYLSFMLICPILLVVSSSVTVLITSCAQTIAEKISQVAAISAAAPLIMFSLKILPLALVWVVFTFIYIFIPNTKVRFSSGLIAGVMAGIIFQVAQFLYVTFQVGVNKHGAIYGSFAALPLFLIWIQTSWLIVLLGAEISFAHQNVDTYEFEHDSLAVSLRFKRLLSLMVCHALVKNFCKGEKPWDATQVSHVLDIPVRLVRQILFELQQAGILNEVATQEDKRVAYQHRPVTSPD